MQLNVFGTEVSKSSGSINNLVGKLSAEAEGEMRRRLEAIEKREKALFERKQNLQEQKSQVAQRRRKVETEIGEMRDRENDAKQEYE